MNTNRGIAIVAGTLFIIAAVTAIVGLVLYDPILNDVNYIIKNSANEIHVLWGAFLEIILALAVIGTSITLFPILKKYSEGLALAAVCFRLLESAIIILGIMSLLAIVTLNHQFSKEINPDVSNYLIAGKLLVAIHNWTFLFGPNLALAPSTFITAYLLHQSKLVPRFVSVLGMFGGPLIFACGLLVLFGVFPQLSLGGGLLAIPVFAYEMSLAIWLIINGFKSPTSAQSSIQNLFKLAANVGKPMAETTNQKSF